jgi:hypothetical protein
MAMQLELLKQLPGWDDTSVTGTVNESFGERLSNALELTFFGVSAQNFGMLSLQGMHAKHSIL